MALWVCDECTTLFAVGAPRCPQCGSEVHHEMSEEDEMPKISKAAGPTYEGVLEPRHVEYPEQTDDETERDDELTGDGTGEALPPVDEDNPNAERDSEPRTVYESGLRPPTTTDTEREFTCA